MKGIWKKAGILALIFMVAVVVYFIWHRGGEEDTNEIYTSMGAESLPLVYPNALGRQMGVLYGYRQDMGQSGAVDELTVLPADLRLGVTIEERESRVTGIRYEIRSLDGEQLVERTDLQEWQSGEDGRISITLPIQNLLLEDRQYMLCLILNTEKGEVRYYTRIVLTDPQIPQQMTDLAVDFSGKIHRQICHLLRDLGIRQNDPGVIPHLSFFCIQYQAQHILPVFQEKILDRKRNGDPSVFSALPLLQVSPFYQLLSVQAPDLITYACNAALPFFNGHSQPEVGRQHCQLVYRSALAHVLPVSVKYAHLSSQSVRVDEGKAFCAHGGINFICILFSASMPYKINDYRHHKDQRQYACFFPNSFHVPIFLYALRKNAPGRAFYSV